MPIHREWGGVVPELASRQHIRDICGVVERALDEAAIDVARSRRDRASRRARAWSARCWSACRSRRPPRAAAGLPLVAVHHLAGHIESLVLQNGELPLPAVVLVVSGGHTSLYLVERPGHYQLLSRTRDDAAGEAYDKVAKLLGLGYPGGPVDRSAGADRQRPRDRAADDAADARRPQRAGAEGRSRLQLQRPEDRGAAARRVAARATDGADSLPTQEIADICASFQRVVVTALIERLFDAARRYQAQERRRRRRRVGEQPSARRR